MDETETKPKRRLRKPKTDIALSPEVREARIAEFIDELEVSWVAKYDSPCIGEANKTVKMTFGIPFPSFILEYLFQLSAFPLERFLHLVGQKGTMKSGFAFEIARWFRKFGGMNYLFDAESKFHRPWALSIIGWDDKLPIFATPSSSTEQWQDQLLDAIARTKTLMDGTKDKVGLGRTLPALFIVDSIMGKISEETQEKIMTAGHAGRSFPIEALSITRFLQTVTHRLSKYPMALIGVNHLKLHKDDRGHMQRSTPGGVHVGFQESLEIEMSSAPHAKPIDTVAYKGKTLRLSTHKNAMGVDRLCVDVDVVWGPERMRNPETGEIKTLQQTTWDWHKATVKFLAAQSPSTVRGRKIREVVDFTLCKGNTRVASSALGISEQNPVSFHEAGELLHVDTERIRALRELHGIFEISHLQPGADFAEQLAAAKEYACYQLLSEANTNVYREVGVGFEDEAAGDGIVEPAA